MVERAPVTVLEAVPKEATGSVRAELEAVGAKVEIKQRERRKKACRVWDQAGLSSSRRIPLTEAHSCKSVTLGRRPFCLFATFELK